MKKKTKKGKKKGFTLIELLVVIAIIGLLATLAIVSMSSARAKARDAKRVSDIRQMSTILDVEDAAAPNTALTGCTGADANTSSCTNPGDLTQFNKFADPSGTAICNSASAATCQYSISKNDGSAAANTADYQICFYLEQVVNGITTGNGLKEIQPGGVFANGCTA
jgi:prepilin-type N-terminal cleavage/methylation domain-containing protein